MKVKTCYVKWLYYNSTNTLNSTAIDGIWCLHRADEGKFLLVDGSM